MTKVIKYRALTPQNIDKNKRYLNNLTVKSIVDSQPPTFLQLKNNKKGALALDMIRLILSDFIRRIFAKQKIDTPQIEQLSNYIHEKYDLLSIEDLYLILQRAEYLPKKPHYGIISKEFIISEINSYLDMKDVEENNKRQQSEFQEKEEKIIERKRDDARDFEDIFKEIEEKISPKTPVRVIKQEKDPFLTFVEALVEFILVRNDNLPPDKISEKYGISVTMAKRLLDASRDYKIGTQVMYHDIYAGFSPGKKSEFAKICKHMFFDLNE